MVGFLSNAEIRDEHLPEVGGKAIGLARLVRLGFPVPKAFVVEASFFDSLHARYPEEHEPEAMAGRIPPELIRRLGAALDELGAAPQGYAIRSSAPLEDAGDASFAGVHETMLSVPRAEVPAALLRCWASGFSPRALEYRRRRGLPAEPADIRMAAVVQVMCRAEAAGVVFTREPGSDSGGIRIEAVPGRGAAPEAGDLRPACFRVDPGGRLERGPAADRFPLKDSILLMLAEWARRAEAGWGRPLDLEWAVEGGRIWLLQARPLAPAIPGPEPHLPPTSGEDPLWVRMALPEILPEVPTPLLRSWLERIDWGAEIRAAKKRPVIRFIEGRIYVNPAMAGEWEESQGVAPGRPLSSGREGTERAGPPAPRLPAKGTMADVLTLLRRDAREANRRPRPGAGSPGESGTGVPVPGGLTDLQLLDKLREAEIGLARSLARSRQADRRAAAAKRVLESLVPDPADRDRLLGPAAAAANPRRTRPGGPGWLRPLRRPLIRKAAEAILESRKLRARIRAEEERRREELGPVLIEIGRRLAGRGILDSDGDAVLLRMEEIERTLRGETDRELRSRVARRREEHLRPLPLPMPERIRESEIRDLPERRGSPRSGGQFFQGLPVGPGRAEGRATVLEGPHQIDRVCPGDILVTPALDASWIPLLPLAGGLIVERGGALSHGSILAREYAVPVVANIPGITGILKSGERLLLDGSAGTIRRLDAPPGSSGSETAGVPRRGEGETRDAS